jgi:hypothetical protein
MNKRALDVIFAVVLFYLAYRIYDLGNFTNLGVAAVLFMSGLSSLFRNSESLARRKFANTCLRVAGILATFILVKMLIFG